MIPLHLTTTTVLVSAEDAERLVRAAAAEWLPGIRALRGKHHSDARVLAVIT
jgi:hypothetical protein